MRGLSNLDHVLLTFDTATPFVTGQFKRGADQWVPHVALSLFELGSLAMTDPTGRGNYHGDVEAVHHHGPGWQNVVILLRMLPGRWYR